MFLNVNVFDNNKTNRFEKPLDGRLAYVFICKILC